MEQPNQQASPVPPSDRDTPRQENQGGQIRGSLVGLWSWTIATGELHWSEECASILGCDVNNLPERLESWEERIHPDDRSVVQVELARVAAGADDWLTVECRTQKDDGHWTWVSLRGQVQRQGDSENGLRITGMIQNVSAPKRAEERFRLFFENSPKAYLFFDDRHTILDCNPSALSLLRGNDKSSVLGLQLSQLTPPRQPGGEDSTEHYREMVALAHRKGSHSFEWTHQRLNGESFPCEVTLIPAPLGDDSTLMSVWRDLSRQKRFELRLSAAIESAPIAIVMIERHGRIVMVNAEAERLFGYSREEMLGRAVEMLIPERFRAGHPRLRMNFFTNSLAKRIGAGRELFGRRKDGTEFPIELGLNPVNTDDGLFVISTVADITIWKQREQQHTDLLRKLSESNQELEQFAFVASHDLQEPLRKVSSCCQALEEDYADKLDEDAREWIAYAVTGSKRMRQLVTDLLEFSRVGTQGKAATPTDSQDAFETAIDNLADTIRDQDVQITSTSLPMVLADPSQMVQLFQNLIANSIKYCDRERPVIEVKAGRSGDSRLFSLKDNGIGIDAAYYERIFQIFQRLHRSDEFAGTGIGLAICKKIVERLGGRIWVESQPDQGSTFFFTFRAVSQHDEEHTDDEFQQELDIALSH